MQGWTLGDLFVGSDPTPASSNFVNGWADQYNHPETPGASPVGDNQGSIRLYTPGGHGIDSPNGNTWRIAFVSPDLSTSQVWQQAVGASVRIAECMGGTNTYLYANVHIYVQDLDCGAERHFVNGVAASIPHGLWTLQTHHWYDESGFPENITVTKIEVCIWGSMDHGDQYQGGIYLDDVVPIMPPAKFYVDDDGGGPDEDGTLEHPFDSIREAIDLAADGNEVIVMDGTYTGDGNRDIDFSAKAITLRSQNGPENCIIDCQGSEIEHHRAFNFHSGEGPDAALIGLTILNGYAPQGGAIRCANSDPTITNCILRNNNAQNGAGIYCDGSSPSLTNCAFIDNDAENGAAVYCTQSTPAIVGCTLTGNDATECAGGIYFDNSSSSIYNCIAWSNTAVTGAHLALKNSSAVTVSYCLAGSDAPNDRYIEPGSVLTWGPGNLTEDPLLEADGLHLTSNSPCIDLGDPAKDYWHLTDIDGCPRLFNNLADMGADEFSPDIHNLTQGTYHGTIQRAIDSAVNGDTVVVPDGIYTGLGNRDVYFYGKTIELRSENGPDHCVIDCHGSRGDSHFGFKFICGEDRNSILDGFTVKNGYGMWGGGLFISFSSSPTIRNCKFINNVANDAGGAITCDSDPLISNCLFLNNDAGRVGGGAIVVTGGNVVIDSCTFVNNYAEWLGAAVSCRGGDTKITNSIFWDNLVYGSGIQEIALRNDPDEATVVDISYCNIRAGRDAIYTQSQGQVNWQEGNIDSDPLLTPDGHLHPLSPCIDAGPLVDVPPDDFDRESRPIGAVVDIGCDEYKDTDGDDLPDYWEERYFGSSSAAAPSDDTDGDGLTDLEECVQFGSDPVKAPYFVDDLAGSDDYDGKASEHLTGLSGPKKTIQAGIDATDDGDTVLVAAGTYTGTGNIDLDFNTKAVLLVAPSGPSATVIDCDGQGRGFLSNSGETSATAVLGFTITNGIEYAGGAYGCVYSQPQIHNCIMTGNTATAGGGALYAGLATMTLANVRFENNLPDAILMHYGDARIIGDVNLISGDWFGSDLFLYGDGTVKLQPGVTLDLDNARIRCNISGPGNIQIDAGSELIIEGEAVVNLSGSGHCDPDPNTGGHIFVEGSLVVQGNATLQSANIDVAILDLDDPNAIQYNNIVLRQAGASFGGEFFVSGNTQIVCNNIVSEGDRYLDLDPDAAGKDRPTISNNRITVIINEGMFGSQGTLLELRAGDYDCGGPNNPDCGSGIYRTDQNSPGFTEDPSENWVLERLQLQERAKLNLTNRQGFEFQDFDDPNLNSDMETIYVKELVMGPNSVLNTALQTLYYQTLILTDANGEEMLRDPPDLTSPLANGSTLQDIPLLGFSLGVIAMNDPNEFDIRVRKRLLDPADEQPDPPDPPDKIGSIERIDNDPDIPLGAGGVMEMRTRAPGMYPATSIAAKGAFARAGDEIITVEFEYMFIDDPYDEAEIVVYLSDQPDVGDNLVEIARITSPEPGRPGSPSSGEFGLFSGAFARGTLNFVRGTYVELELRGQDAQCWIDNWDPTVHCSGAVCGEYDNSIVHYGVNIYDFLILLAEIGLVDPDDIGKGCLDLVTDGCINADDLRAWNMSQINNRCPLDSKSLALDGLSPPIHRPKPKTSYNSAPLRIAGKPAAGVGLAVPGNYLYDLDLDATAQAQAGNVPEGRLITDSHGNIYQIDSFGRLIRLDTADELIKPNPNISYQGSRVSVGDDLMLLDAAFHPNDANIVFVVPVRVDPLDGDCPYMAAAKLRVTGQGDYDLIKLYGKDPAKESAHLPRSCDDVSQFTYEPDLQHLHEIEIGRDGRVCVLSAHVKNTALGLLKNNWISIYDENTGNDSEVRVDISDVDIVGPAQMVVSRYDQKLYLTSSMAGPNVPGDLKTKVYRYSIDTTNPAQPNLLFDGPVDINSPAPDIHSQAVGYIAIITSMTVNHRDGTLYATGFTAPKFPATGALPNGVDSIFTKPMIAAVKADEDWTQAATITNSDLVLPMSMVWVGSECTAGDINSDGHFDFEDIASLSDLWLADCAVQDCTKADLGGTNTVNLVDLAILFSHWLGAQCR